jgi:site-specific DNA-methyltransferase (adenine-specific)
MIDLFEYVYVFQKAGNHPDGKDDLHKMEFIENVIGIWKIRPVKKIIGSQKANIYKHPCPFPVELAKRVIKLYSHVGDVVFDPFAGVLTTAIAAAEAGRSSISIDISKKYCNTGLARFSDIHADLLGLVGTSEIKLL